MKNIMILFGSAIVISLVASARADTTSSQTKPNVLFIAIDDMNDWTGFLGGHPQAITPNMDRLARRGVNFTNAHCIAPACSPCRLGLLYGVEPFHSGDLADVPWVGRTMASLKDDYRFRGDQAWEQVQRSYLACISWADYNVGRVLEALEKSPYADNTVIVLWSDHGYHQSEKRSFRKFSLWEESTRVPFILFDPRQKNASEDRTCMEAVSLINIYRTLGDLAGIDVPKYVDGQSLTAQMKDPAKPIAAPAITTWGRGNYAVRDDQWRYIRYFDGGEELYDHSRDPQEWNNLADDSKYASTKKELSSFLPKDEAALVKQGVALWNVTDADRPERLNGFKNKQWTEWKEKLKPAIE
jgi:arylsulfatase A-like enzyme